MLNGTLTNINIVENTCEMVEATLLRQNDQFWPFSEKYQQVVYKSLCRLKLSLHLKFLQYYIVVIL